MGTKDSDQFNFEQSIDKLSQIVEQMEKGDLPLEQALKQFESGIKITRECQTALKSAQQKVEQLIEKNGNTEIGEYDSSDD